MDELIERRAWTTITVKDTTVDRIRKHVRRNVSKPKHRPRKDTYEDVVIRALDALEKSEQDSSSVIG